jgi:germination protein M
MRRYGLFLLLAVLLLAAGCGAHTLEGKDYAVYFLDQSNEAAQALKAESRTLDQEADQVEGLLQAILSGPESESLSNVIPASVSLRGWALTNGLLTVDLSGSYGLLSGIDLTLADYSMVLTLTQLEEVEAVMITVDGQVLSYRDHQRLTAEDVKTAILQDEILENAD